MRLVDAYLLNRDHDIKQMFDSRICDCTLKHGGRAIREDCRFETRRLLALKRFRYLGKRVEGVEIQIHQALTKSAARESRVSPSQSPVHRR